MDTTREYQLLQTFDGKTHHVIKGGFVSEDEAFNHAKTLQSRVDEEYKIRLVTTIMSITDIFTVDALPSPSLEAIASNLASVYAQSIDWSDEDFTNLNESDKETVREMVYADTDDCDCCGWTFQSDYLSHTDSGLICDRCEDEQENDDD